MNGGGHIGKNPFQRKLNLAVSVERQTDLVIACQSLNKLMAIEFENLDRLLFRINDQIPAHALLLVSLSLGGTVFVQRRWRQDFGHKSRSVIDVFLGKSITENRHVRPN